MGAMAGRFLKGAATLLLVWGLGAPAALWGHGIILIGSDTLVPLAQRLAEEWMRLQPEAVVSVSGGGSSRGLKAVRDGAAHIGLVSSPTETIEAARPKGAPALAIHRLSRDAVIPVVHPDNPVPEVSLAQLRAIFSGDIRNWREVGGPDAPIEVFSHGGETGTYEAWKERVMGEKRVVLPTARVMGTGPLLRAMAETPYAIGYVTYAGLTGAVRALPVGGIPPTRENISSETFPIVRSLKFVTLPEPGEEVRRFVDFCLDPDQGGRIQKELGLIAYPPQ